MRRDTLTELIAARRDARPVVLVRWLERGEERIVDNEPTGDRALDEAITETLRSDRSRTLSHNGERVFLQAFNPPLRLLIIGAVHIAQSLAPLARLSGYHVIVIDPRRGFVNDQRFAGIEWRSQWPDDALSELEPDSRTAIVTLTHDPKIDDPALQAALHSPAFYIGALGSPRTHGARLERLYSAGFEARDTRRIHGPVGLDIGAVTPAEIAVAIMAEITARLRSTVVEESS